MAEEETKPEAVEEELSETEEEFRALFADTKETEKRLLDLAQQHETAGRPEMAALYRELKGSVLTLVSDLVTSCGGAFVALEESMDELYDRPAGAPPEESVLLSPDAKEYLDYFNQILRFLNELLAMLPDGADGAAQRDILDKLVRVTKERIEFTEEIAEEDDDEPEEPETPAEH